MRHELCDASHAAAAALARQYFIEGWYPTGTPQPHHAFIPSGALLKAAAQWTIDMTGMVGYPNNQEGWGLIRLQNALFFPEVARATHPRVGYAPRRRAVHRRHDPPCRCCEQYPEAQSDAGLDRPAGRRDSATPVVNDLDLEVVSPDGTQTFRGNVFAGGVSRHGRGGRI